MNTPSPCHPMRTHQLTISILIAFLSPVVALAEVEFTKRGNPTWEPVGGFISAVDLQNDPDLDWSEEGLAFRLDASSPKNVYIPSLDLFVPVEPHSGPYENIHRESIAKHKGFESDVFLVSDLLNSDRLIRGFVIVPTAGSPTGASVGGENSLIIDPDVFPITGRWAHEFLGGDDLLNECASCREPNVLDNLDDMGIVTDIQGNTHDFTGQNWNRFSNSWVTGWVSDPPIAIAGEYQGVIEYRDAQDNGWDMSFFYTVIPSSTVVDGDLNFDSELDMRDLDIAVQNVALGSTHSRLDLNGDDVVGLSDVHFWVTDLKDTWIGDANLDGEFNSEDFVDVFLAGKYLTGELARWNEGDWNADERFDSSDFVAAFTGGGYLMGSRAGVAAVPEPSSLVLLAIGGLVLTRARRRVTSHC